MITLFLLFLIIILITFIISTIVFLSSVGILMIIPVTIGICIGLIIRLIKKK